MGVHDIAVTTRLKQLLKLLTVHNRRMDPGWIGKELDDQLGQFFRIDIFLTPSATTIFCAE